MEPEKAPNHQGIVEKEKQSWGHHSAGFRAVLQSCSNQKIMVLAQKYTHRSMEQNTKPRNEPTIIW